MSSAAEVKRIPFQLHPRVFQALGSELVTSDVVAIIELVKNSYDAFASRVDVRFIDDENGKLCLEIEDDGVGMDAMTIDEVWCMVATPYRELNPKSIKGKRKRRTTGAKGLGRLSSARLGDRMQMITRSLEDGAWQVDVVWTDLVKATSLSECSITRQRYQAKGFDRKEGTLIRILDLKATWDDLQVEDLNEALSRLTSPFEEIDDFAIYFAPPGSSVEASKIETSVFLKSPTYMLKGTFDADGTLSYGYVYKPLSGKSRKESRSVDWAIVQKDINDSLKENRVELKAKPVCGPFEFEIRVWDLDQKSLTEAESKYDMRKADLRRQIRAFKGISLYRDRVLVLPKSDNNRDWLGLDLRRVSKVGSRLSTSQIVGYVAVTADANPDIDDTSDRERLARNEAVAEFERVLKDAVSRLEEQRDRDQELEEPKMRELFADISPQRLLDQAQELVAQNASLDDAMPLLNSYSKNAEKAREQIEKQFFYYSRLATIGTIAEMLVHEVGNNGGAIDAFVQAVKDWLEGKTTDRKIVEKRLVIAAQAVTTLQRLAERFRPLAARNFKRGRRTSSLRETLEASLQTLDESIKQGKIDVEYSLKGPDELRIDPGELFPVIHNLLDNAIYWLHHSERKSRKLRIEASGSKGMVTCTVSDNGPGVELKDLERIFNAGVTRRPNGSGMGLTVAGELVEGNEGKIFAESPGELGGATFRFQIPAAL